MAWFRGGLASVALGLVLSFAVFVPARAEPMAELLSDFIKNNDKIKAAEADLEAAQQRGKAAYGAWYPSFKAVAWTGRQHISSTNHRPKELDLTLTQLIYDFGSTTSKVEVAKLTTTQAELALTAARQSALLEAATAYIQITRYAEALKNARESVASIQKQTGLEEARVQLGGGYSTDVLQAKAQLSTAERQRVAAELDFTQAINRFRAVFKREPGDLSTFHRIQVPMDRLPASIDAAIDIAGERNPTIQASFLATAIARENIVGARADGFFPKVEFVADHKSKNEEGGVAGNKKDTVLKGQVTWPFNLGLTAINTLKAAEASDSASVSRLNDARITVSELVRNSWERLGSKKISASIARNEVALAAEFLELARRERALGKRSLIDVLSGETVHRTALTAAVGEEADLVVSAFTLLTAMGQIKDEDIVRVAEDPQPAPEKAKPKAPGAGATKAQGPEATKAPGSEATKAPGAGAAAP